MFKRLFKDCKAYSTILSQSYFSCWCKEFCPGDIFKWLFKDCKICSELCPVGLYCMLFRLVAVCCERKGGVVLHRMLSSVANPDLCHDCR